MDRELVERLKKDRDRMMEQLEIEAEINDPDWEEEYRWNNGEA